jgi:hypothetical protein
MKRIVLLSLVTLALAVLGAAAPATKKSKDVKIAVSTHVDRTAIWVGDTFRYTVRLTHDPDIEFVVDHLKKENLNLAPFVVRNISFDQGSIRGSKKITDMTLLLTTYETGQTELRIPSFPLFYFTRAGATQKNKDSPAESFTVPPARIGLRSTLTTENPRLRDSRDIQEFSSQRWIVASVLGLLGITFLTIQTGRWLWASSHAERPQTRHLTRRARKKMLHDFLRKIQTMEGESGEDPARFYSEVSQFVRQYVSESLKIDVSSLTPDEIEALLKNRGKERAGIAVKAILEKCERVLYTPHGMELGSEWRSEVKGELGSLRALAR